MDTKGTDKVKNIVNERLFTAFPNSKNYFACLLVQDRPEQQERQMAGKYVNFVITGRLSFCTPNIVLHCKLKA